MLFRFRALAASNQFYRRCQDRETFVFYADVFVQAIF